MVYVTVNVYDSEGSYIDDFEIVAEDGQPIHFAALVEPELPDDVSSYLGENEIFLGWFDYNDELCDDSYCFDFDTEIDVYLGAQFNAVTPNGLNDINVNRDTSNVYIYGLDADYSFAGDVKSGLENDELTIIITRADGVTEINDDERVGTGCFVKCVNRFDHSIVYDVATVILYGDVNGDGEVDFDDYDAMFDETMFNIAIEGDLFRIAGDVNGDTVIDGFDMAKVDLQISGVRALDQTAEYFK